MSLSRIVELLEHRLTVTKSDTLEFGASDTSKTMTFEHRGAVMAYVLDLPNWANDVTATIAITNADTYQVYSKAALAKNTTHFVNEDSNNFPLCQKVPCDGIMTVTVTLSGVPGTGGGDVAVKLFLR